MRCLGLCAIGWIVFLGGQALAQPFRLSEIRGFQEPPHLDAPGGQDREPVFRDLRGQELRRFLGDYEFVRNEDVVAAILAGSDAIADFGSETRPITFFFASCPWEDAALGMLQGKPDLLVFIVEHDFVIFQRKGLCADAPPGFEPDAPEASGPR